MILFGLSYSIPLPLALVWAMRALNQKKITPVSCILCCKFPPVSIFNWYANKSFDNDLNLSEESQAIISVLQGPFRVSKNDSHKILYWEVMISIRRLLISAMTLIPFGSISLNDHNINSIQYISLPTLLHISISFQKVKSC